ncbi:MAG: hypothetical protein ACLQCU_13280 [Acidimicrobiales bacterium]
MPVTWPGTSTTPKPRSAGTTRPARTLRLPVLSVPDVDAALNELEYATSQLGSDGVTVETNTGGSYLGDP